MNCQYLHPQDTHQEETMRKQHTAAKNKKWNWSEMAIMEGIWKPKGQWGLGFLWKAAGRSWPLRWALQEGRNLESHWKLAGCPQGGDQRQGNHCFSNEHSMFKEPGRRSTRCVASRNRALPFPRMWSLSPRKGWLTSPFTPCLGDESLLHILPALHITHTWCCLWLPQGRLRRPAAQGPCFSLEILLRSQPSSDF